MSMDDGSMATPGALAAGSTLGRYQIVRMIGSGGMGIGLRRSEATRLPVHGNRASRSPRNISKMREKCGFVAFFDFRVELGRATNRIAGLGERRGVSECEPVVTRK